jgi:carboxylate-amine ligase
VPIFRAFPRVGLPPRFADWADFERRVETMSESGLIEDYTFLWYDVRPHPRLGTIEVRAMDSQTRVEHTVALSALVVSLVKLLVEQCQQGVEQREPAWEILDENRWLAARHGLEAELFDQSSGERRGVRELSEQLLAALAPHASELGCARELEGVSDLLGAGNGAQRQLIVYEANHDLHELVAEIVATSDPDREDA